MDLAFPLRIAAQRRLADTDYASHVRDMIEQLIFTNPGERVNRPDLGSGLYQLIFAPNSPELAATIEFTMLAALQRYLGDIIDIAGLEVNAIDDALAIMVAYRILATDEQVVSRFLTGRPP